MENSDDVNKTAEDERDFARNLPESTFEMLNDDCLLHIFSFLSLRNQINFSLVCQRFHEITEIALSRKYKTLDSKILNDLTVEQTSEFLKQIGKTVTTITCCGRDFGMYTEKPIIKFLPLFCANIKCLNFKSIVLHPGSYESLKNIFENLTSLTISDCYFKDSDCITLKNCQKLQYLDLSQTCITGKHLISLANLKILNLWNCWNVQSTYFMELCKTCKLAELNIMGCNGLTKLSLEMLLRTQTCLEVLIISNTLETDDLNDIVRLPNLRHLEFVSFEVDIRKDFFNELVRYKSKNLKILAFYTKDFNESQKEHILSLIELEELKLFGMINNGFLAKLAVRLPNLKKLDCSQSDQLGMEAVISYIVEANNLEFINLSKCFPLKLCFQFVLNLIEALKIVNRPKPINVFLQKCRVPNSKTKLTLLEHQHLLNLSYGSWENPTKLHWEFD